MKKLIAVVALLVLVVSPAPVSSSAPATVEIQGRVFTGYPQSVRVPGACVAATADGVTDLATACADADGLFRLSVPPGVSFAVRATATGYLPGWSWAGLDFESADRYSISPVHTTYDISVHLNPAAGSGSFHGRLLDLAGVAVPNVSVTMLMANSIYEGTLYTDASGTFRSGPLPAGSFTLISGNFSRTVVVASGVDTEADWRLAQPSGVIDVRTVDAVTGATVLGTCLDHLCGRDGVTSILARPGTSRPRVDDRSYESHNYTLLGGPTYYFRPAPTDVTVVAGQRTQHTVRLDPAGFLVLSSRRAFTHEPVGSCFFLVPSGHPLGTVDLRYRTEPETDCGVGQSTHVYGPFPLGKVRVFGVSGGNLIGWVGPAGLVGDRRQAAEIPVVQGISVLSPVDFDYSGPAINRTIRGATWDPLLGRQVSVCAYPFAESAYLKWTDVDVVGCGTHPMIYTASVPMQLMIVGEGYATTWVDDATSRVDGRLLYPSQHPTADSTFDVVLKPAGRLVVTGGATEVTLFDAHSGDEVAADALNTGPVFVRYRLDGRECWHAPAAVRRRTPVTAVHVDAGRVTTVVASSAGCGSPAPQLIPDRAQNPPPPRRGIVAWGELFRVPAAR